MNIIQRFIPASNKETRPGYKLNPTYITIHETDNEGNKANAEAHARLQESGNTRQASWHLTVDDHYCYQSIPFDEVAWSCGDGGNGTGNRNSIALEICVNKDGDYNKAVANAAEITKQLMAQFHIPVDHVVQHNHWSGKNCPRHLRSGDKGPTWDKFISSLKEVNGHGVVKVNVHTVVRKGPNAAYDIVKTVEKGQAYKSYGFENGWYNVGAGWVYGECVTFKGV
jgi:N-acetylmuramoyl-L-alanine amidase CwlA